MNLNLLAAEGWIELGNSNEAVQELSACPLEVKCSIEWLKIWVRVYVPPHRWDEVEKFGEALVKRALDDPPAIMTHANAYHKEGRSWEALLTLQYAVENMKKAAWNEKERTEFLNLLDRVSSSLD